MKNTDISYDRRYIKSGQIIEIIDYERPIYKKLDKEERNTGSDQGRSVEATEEDKQRHREDTLSRARQDTRRLINANVYQYKNQEGNTFRPVFLTLTYAENVTELEEANHDFRCFIKRLNEYVYGRKISNQLKYVVVPEFQKRGAVHYHLILFNMPYIKSNKLAEIWQQGFIKINAIDKVDNVGAYVVKYMNKEKEDERLKGQKCYFSSRGLLKPEEIRCRTGTEKEKELDELADSLTPNLVYQVQHTSDYYGSIMYKQYNLSRTKL